MSSISKICWPRQESIFSESEESLLSRHSERKSSDAFDRSAPSYLRRLLGIKNLPHQPSLQIRELPVVSTEKLIGDGINRVQNYYNTSYGCSPQQYRPGMVRRLYLGYGQDRGTLLFLFPHWLKAEPTTALRLLRQVVALPFRDRLDREWTHESLRDKVLPALAEFSKRTPDLSDNAMRDLVEAFAAMEKAIHFDKNACKKINGLKRAFLGGESAAPRKEVRFQDVVEQYPVQQHSYEPPGPDDNW